MGKLVGILEDGATVGPAVGDVKGTEVGLAEEPLVGVAVGPVGVVVGIAVGASVNGETVGWTVGTSVMVA